LIISSCYIELWWGCTAVFTPQCRKLSTFPFTLSPSTTLRKPCRRMNGKSESIS